MKIIDFMFNYAIDPETSLPSFPSLNHWLILLRRQWPKADTFLLVTWPEDEANRIGEQFGEELMDERGEGNRFFRGALTEELLNQFSQVPSSGNLPWYQLHLLKGENPLLYMDMFGGNLVLWVEDEEVEEIKKEMEGEAAIREMMVMDPTEIAALKNEEMDMIAQELERMLLEEGSDGTELLN